jgi:hypothetical protein
MYCFYFYLEIFTNFFYLNISSSFIVSAIFYTILFFLTLRFPSTIFLCLYYWFASPLFFFFIYQSTSSSVKVHNFFYSPSHSIFCYIVYFLFMNFYHDNYGTFQHRIDLMRIFMILSIIFQFTYLLIYLILS